MRLILPRSLQSNQRPGVALRGLGQKGQVFNHGMSGQTCCLSRSGWTVVSCRHAASGLYAHSGNPSRVIHAWRASHRMNSSVCGWPRGGTQRRTGSAAPIPDPLLLVTRFDRKVSEDTVQRLPAIDGCQALVWQRASNTNALMVIPLVGRTSGRALHRRDSRVAEFRRGRRLKMALLLGHLPR